MIRESFELQAFRSELVFEACSYRAISAQMSMRGSERSGGKTLLAREIRVVELFVDAVVVHDFLHVGFGFIETYF